MLKRSSQADTYIEELRVRLSKAAEQERSREVDHSELLILLILTIFVNRSHTYAT